MRKIINNRVYDTETALLIGSIVKTIALENMSFKIEEFLYRTRSGRYFLFYPMDTCPSGQNKPTEYNHKINQIDYKNAELWGRKNLLTVEYDKYFNTVEDSNKKVVISVSVLQTTKNKLDKLKSESPGTTVGELIDEFVSSIDE